MARLSSRPQRGSCASPRMRSKQLDLKRRSVDARKKNDVRIIYTVDVAVKGREDKILKMAPLRQGFSRAGPGLSRSAAAVHSGTAARDRRVRPGGDVRRAGAQPRGRAGIWKTGTCSTRSATCSSARAARDVRREAEHRRQNERIGRSGSLPGGARAPISFLRRCRTSHRTSW